MVRRTIAEPLGTAVTSSLAGFDFGSIFSGLGSALGGLFRAEAGRWRVASPTSSASAGPNGSCREPQRHRAAQRHGARWAGDQQSITIDARGADAGVEARLRVLSAQVLRQASAATLDAIRRGGSAAPSCGVRAMTEYAWPSVLRRRG